MTQSYREYQPAALAPPPDAMAPVYSTIKLGGKQRSPIHFELNGLKNQAPSAVHGLNIYGKASIRELAYDGYRANIDAFIFATLSGKRQATCLEAFGPVEVQDFFLPLSKPGFAFCPMKATEVEKMERLAKKIDAGAEVRQPKKQQAYILSPNPPKDIQLLHQLAKIQSIIFSPPAGYAPPGAFVTIMFLETMIGGFLRTNTYPAFTTNPLKANWELRHSDQEGTTHDLVDNERDEGDRKRGREEYSNSVQRKKWKRNQEDMMVDEEIVADWESPDDPDTDSYTVCTGIDQVFMAKPSPFPAGTNIMSFAELPELPGLAFPYFEGMVLPDFSTLKSCVVNHFFRCLSSSMNLCKQKVKEMKSDLNSISLTEYGKALSHICLGIRLSTETQTRLSIIMEGSVYNGFVLLGEGFSVFDGSSWHDPESSEDLRKSVSFMDASEKAITDLLKLFDDLKVADTTNVPVAWGRDSFSDLEFLSEQLGKISFKIEQEEKVKASANELLRKINFRRGRPFIRIEPSSIHGAVVALTSDTEVPLSYPLFIPSFATDLSSKTFRVLSKFGPDAISFWNESKGDKYSLEVEEKEEGKGKKRAKSVEAVPECPPEIVVQVKPLSRCIGDWKTVVENRAIKMDLKERARDFRCHTLKAEGSRQDVWKALLEVGKIAGPEKKKKKVSVVSKDAEDVFDEVFG